MHYSEGRFGRVFVLRIDDGEDVIQLVTRFVSEKGIESAVIQLIGALRRGRLVTGPEEPVIPPVPHFEEVGDGWEVIGLGTLYQSDEGPKIHIHVSAGRGKDVLTGCLREIGTTYLIVEVVILELQGINARREMDEATGLHLLVLEKELH